MSYRASEWAIRQKTGSASAKVVLLVLAEAADDAGFTFIGREETAKRSELSPRAVVNQMAHLEVSGLIRRERRFNGHGYRTSDAIYLQVGRAIQGELGAHRESSNVHDVHFGLSASDAPRGDAKEHDVHLGLSAPDDSLSAPDDKLRCTSFTLTSQRTVREPSVPSKAPAEPKPDLFTDAWEAFPQIGRTRSSTMQTRKVWAAAVKRAGTAERLVAAVRRFAASPEAQKDGGQYVKGFHRWLRDGRFEHWLDGPDPAAPAPATQVDPNASWRIKMRQLVESRSWRDLDWGPRPSRTAPQPADVQVPDVVLAEFGFPTVAEQKARTPEPKEAA